MADKEYPVADKEYPEVAGVPFKRGDIVQHEDGSIYLLSGIEQGVDGKYYANVAGVIFEAQQELVSKPPSQYSFFTSGPDLKIVVIGHTEVGDE